MSSIRSENTLPERQFYHAIKVLYSEGVRYRKHARNVLGRPDLAIPKQRIAIFIDSEFWHGKDLLRWQSRLPKVYWRSKIERNVQRDLTITLQLRRNGWSVIRVWAKQVQKDPEGVVRLVRKRIALRDRLCSARGRKEVG